MSEKISKTKRTSQYIDNLAFDETYEEPTILPVEESNGTLVRKQNNPIDGYGLANLDVTASPYYLGYLRTNGHWYIKQIDTTAGTVLYIKGTTDYDTSWTGRAGLSYAAFNTIFN